MKYCSRMNLNQIQLEKAVQRALKLLAELKNEYPELRLYPVFCRFGPRSGQCNLTTKHLSIVSEFPKMMVDTSGASRLAQLLQEHKRAKKYKLPIDPAELMEVRHLIKYLLKTKRSLYNGDVNIEFRTGVLKYDLLVKLQQDPRLPPGLNTIGNIRVVAGTLETLQAHLPLRKERGSNSAGISQNTWIDAMIADEGKGQL